MRPDDDSVRRDRGMIDGNQDQERADRDRGRSEEAHWQVAEAAAQEEEERSAETARESATEHEEWENEGGAPGRDP
jgi:hypothetical protein